MKKLFALACCLITLIASAQSTFETNIYSSSHTLSTQGIMQLKDSNYLVLCSGANYTGPFVIKLDSKGSIIAQKTLGKEITSITTTPDGNFAGIGGNQINAFYFVKYDSLLNETMTKTYSLTQGVDTYYPIQKPAIILQTPDSGYILSGTFRYSNDSYGVTVFKIRNDGSYVANSLQLNAFNTDFLGTAQIVGIINTKDGGVVMLCNSEKGDASNNSPLSWFLLKTTFPTNGDAPSAWARKIHPGFGIPQSSGYQTPDVTPNGLFSTSDSGFIFTSYVTGDFPQPSSQAICKVDANGNFVWAKRLIIPYCCADFDYGIKAIVETKDSGYVFSDNNSIASSAHTDTTVSYLIKMKKDGTLLWNKTLQYRDSVSTTFSNFITTYDGGFAAAGNYGNLFLSSTDIAVYKFDSAFNTCNPLNTIANFPIEDVGFILTPDDNVFFFPAIDSLNIGTASVAQTATNLHSLNMCSETLPVQLLSFNAILQNKTVNVAWKTTNEINTDHFVVERSRDARTFTSLQTVTAKGNGSTNFASYAAIDLQPLQGTSYYRLREVGKDGKIAYSNIVSVTVLANGMLVISPNPVHDNVHILLQSRISGQATFVVTDATGKIVAKQKSQIVVGTNTFQIPSASLSKGMYVLKVIQNNAVQSVKFIKE